MSIRFFPVMQHRRIIQHEKRRGRFYQLLHALSREKIIIFSTHNLEELREADIIVDLEKLHIRQVSEK